MFWTRETVAAVAALLLLLVAGGHIWETRTGQIRARRQTGQTQSRISVTVPETTYLCRP